MPNNFQLNGGLPQKPTRYAPIHIPRFFQGLWTQRSPLRDAGASRIEEKFYGMRGDAMIAGSNVEISNRLTPIRRPGHTVYNSSSFVDVLDFYSFRMFNTASEQIKVMVDTSTVLYDGTGPSTKTSIWAKSDGAGQTFMQSVGNSLFFGNGVDQKKWMQTLNTWAANTNLDLGSGFPDYFIIDNNGNIQQLIAALDSPGGTPILSGGTPQTGNSRPNFEASTAGQKTKDNTAYWVNRGSPMVNWGIADPTSAGAVAPTLSISGDTQDWQPNTYYADDSVIVVSGNGLWQVTTAGKTSAGTPSWASSPQTDGTAVWTKIQTWASLTWSAHHAYSAGDFVKGNAYGTSCLFKAEQGPGISFNGAVTGDFYNTATTAGVINLTFPQVSPDATATIHSLMFNSRGAMEQIGFLPVTDDDPNVHPMVNETLNGAGEITGVTTPCAFDTSGAVSYQAAFYGKINVPAAGKYTFYISFDDSFVGGFGPEDSSGAVASATGIINPLGQPSISFNPNGLANTFRKNYPIIMGINTVSPGYNRFVGWTVYFPAAGIYPFEFNFGQNVNEQVFGVTANGNQIVPTPIISATNQPIWPAWTTTAAPNKPSIFDTTFTSIDDPGLPASKNLRWRNLGPVTDFARRASTNVLLPGNAVVVDSNGNDQQAFRVGVSGTTAPAWQTLRNQLTNDGPTHLIWINEGVAAAPPTGKLSTFNGGYKYCIALVNTLDNTVSNAGKLTAAIEFKGATGVQLAAGSGLPGTIDPQADYVAIFRTTDGEATPFLITGTGNSIYTLPLADYQNSGYLDTATDEDLNNLISADIAGENTPPPKGIVNLSYHLNRIWGSVGNTVVWSTGPDTPVGNGINGFLPDNFDTLPSLVKRLVPLTIGVLVFTVSDIYLIQGDGTAGSPIQPGKKWIENVGLGSFNALSINGSVIYMMASDKQILRFDPHAGIDEVGMPIGDQFEGNNWDPTKAYVSWHISGSQDKALYVSDGLTGWFRLLPTPAPETGVTWSPFATIEGGMTMVKSVEVSPGVHKLLVARTGTSGTTLDTLDSDNFNRADGASLGSSWITPTGGTAVSVKTNAAYGAE